MYKSSVHGRLQKYWRWLFILTLFLSRLCKSKNLSTLQALAVLASIWTHTAGIKEGLLLCKGEDLLVLKGAKSKDGFTNQFCGQDCSYVSRIVSRTYLH